MSVQPNGKCTSSVPVDGLSIATWNVQGGLAKSSNRQILCDDLAEKKVDVAALQETKVRDYSEFRQLPHGYRLVLLPQESTEAPHGGLGFAFSPRIVESVVSIERHGDRIASADILQSVPKK